MLRLRRVAALGVALCCALTVSAQTGSGTMDRSIPATEDNQEYFATTQALFALGEPRQSSCGAQSQRIEECIIACNSPGLQERSGCCCDARPSREFFVGIRGGCRYRQQLQNFTTRLIYSSTPLDNGPRYFDPISCAPVAETDSDEECVCSKSWQASTEELAERGELPTPSPSQTPGLSPPVASPPGETEASVAPPRPAESLGPLGSGTIIPAPLPLVSPLPVRTPLASRSPRPSPFKQPGGPLQPGGAPNVGVLPSPSVEIDESPEPSVGDVDGDGDVDSDDEELAADMTDENDDGVINAEDEEAAAEDDDGSVCVEESHLVAAGIPKDHMVHAEGISARVLCPGGALPCGTPNHKIRREGRGLSYADLCREFVTCEERTAVVNSVYTHLWEETEHDGMHLTMYDISYPEPAQIALHSVMSAGRRVLRTVRSIEV